MKAVLFHAIALVVLFGALQVSELVAVSCTDMTERALQLRDLLFVGGTVCIMIRMFKTDLFRKGSDVDLCPVLALREYLRVGRTMWVLFLFTWVALC